MLSFFAVLGALINLFDTGTKKDPLLKQMPSGELAVCRDEMTIFLMVDQKGDFEKKLAVTWSDVPLGLEFHDPYIIAVLPKHIEICSRSPQCTVQRIDASSVQRINRGPHCYAASGNNVWR